MWGKCFFAPGVGSEGASAARPARGGLAGAAATAGKGDRTAGGWPRRSRGMANGRGHGWGLPGRHGGRHCEGAATKPRHGKRGLRHGWGVLGWLGGRHCGGGCKGVAATEPRHGKRAGAARLGAAWAAARRAALRGGCGTAMAARGWPRRSRGMANRAAALLEGGRDEAAA